MKKSLLFVVSALFAFMFNIDGIYAKSSKNNHKNFGIIVSGPSGVGKTSVIEGLLNLHKDELVASISATTRAPRIGEINGKHYHFVDREKFKTLVKKNEFLEYSENYGNFYGTPRRNYIEAVENGIDIIFALSVDGMIKAKKNKKMDFVTVFILPPSEKILYERLKNRKTENSRQLENRIKKAKEELSQATKYDYMVYNIDLDSAVKQLDAIYLAEQKKREK